MKNPTRRELAVMAAASLVAATVEAQTPPAPPTTDWYQAALDSQKQNAQTLAQFQVPMSVEPAFQFKA